MMMGRRDAADEVGVPRIEVVRLGGTVRVALAGEFDLTGERSVRDAIQLGWALGAEPLLIDLTDLSFMDSTGVRLLVAAQLAAESRGRRIVLRLGPAARRVLELTGVMACFEVST